jgi:hypothetical protein
MSEVRYVRVWKQLTPEMRERLKAFWLANKALNSPEQADKRAEDVVYVMENEAGEIVGACSVYLGEAPRLKQPMYFYRAFTRKEDRVYGRTQIIFEKTYELLKSEGAAKEARGIMVSAENPRLAGEAARKAFERHGFRYLGLNPKNQHTWLKPF